MVVGAFPAAKLASLLLKQVSKPIANAIKNRAKTSPFFRKYVCMPPAQLYNWCEVQAKMWVLNLGKPVNIPVLNEAMAIELGANLLGEGIIFFIAAVAIIAEYNRSANKEAAKEAAKAEEMAKLNSTIMELYLQMEQQQTEIRELKRLVYDLDSRVVQKPWVPKKEPKLPEPDPPRSPPGTVLGLPGKKVDPSSGQYLDNAQESKTIAPDIALVNYEHPQGGVLLNALRTLENDVLHLNPKERVDGIVTEALKHFYKDVFKVQWTV